MPDEIKWKIAPKTALVVSLFILGTFMGWSVWMTKMVYAGEKASELNSARLQRLEDIGPPPPPWFESQVNTLSTKLDVMDTKLTMVQIQVGIIEKRVDATK